jgi:hypothetical protein
MKSSFLRSWRSKLILIGIACVILATVMASIQRVYWVGQSDVDVEFIVTDVRDEEPINGAIIEVETERGFCDEAEGAFSLTTDSAGRAKRLVKKCLSFGAESWYKNTFGIHLPNWHYRASAPGYTTTEMTELDTPDNSSRVKRSDGMTILTVQVRLHKIRPNTQ